MIIGKTNSSISGVLRDTFRPVDEQVRHMLGLLDDDEHFAWLLWWCPDDADWTFNPGPVEDAYGGSYLQAGG
jgi:hypothetical protein